MLNQTASSSGAFVVGDQKVCILPVEYSKRFSKLFGTPTTAEYTLCPLAKANGIE